MRQLSYFPLAILLLFSSIIELKAQDDPAKSKLTLKDAVIGQYRSLQPHRLRQLNWRKGTDYYTFIDSKISSDSLMQAIAGEKAELCLSLDQLNKGLKLKEEESLKYFPYLHWKNKDEVRFSYKNGYYEFNLKKGRGKKLFDYPANAENKDFSYSTDQLAYTIENDLFIKNSKDSLRISNESDEYIIHGKAVHRFEFGISKGTFWSKDGEKLAFYYKNENMVVDYPITDMTSIPAAHKNVKYPMAGTASHHAKLGIYYLSSNDTLYLNIGGDPEHYITNVSWGPKSKFIYLALLNRGQDHLKFQKYNAESGELVKTLFEEKDEKYIQPLHVASFVSDNQFVWLSRRNGRRHLYQYDTEGNLIAQLSDGDWDVTEILGLSDDKRKLIVMGTHNLGLNHIPYLVDIEKKEVNRLSNNGYHYSSYKDGSPFVIDRYSTKDTVWHTQVIDIEDPASRNTLNLPSSPLEDYELGTVEIVQIQGDDHLLNGRLIRPKDFNPEKKYPVIVYVYGGPGIQMVTNSWQASARLWMHYMASKGYVVFTLDNRGSSHRGKDFEQATFRNLGEQEIIDQVRGIDYLKGLPYIDTSRMAVHGWSFGGFMTTSLMLKRPGLFKVGVAGGPVMDWRMYEVMYTERYMDTPEENEEGYEQSALIDKVDQLQGNLMLIHGDQDDVVLMQHSMLFLKSAVDHGKQVDFFVYPNHKHNVRGSDRLHLMEKVLNYIDEKLKLDETSN